MSWWEEEYKAALERGRSKAEAALGEAESKVEGLRQAQPPDGGDEFGEVQASEDGEWITARRAAEIVRRSSAWVRERLIRWGQVSAELRDGRWWVLAEDAKRMAAYYRERDERYEVKRELRKTRTVPKERWGRRARRETPVRVDFSATPLLPNEIWIETARAADYLCIEPTTFRRMAKARGMAYRDVRKPNAQSGSGHNKLKRVREWALSHVHLLMDEREAVEGWRTYPFRQWPDRKGRPIVTSDLKDVPPATWLIPLEEAALILGVSRGRVSQLVRTGRLFGWQEHPGKPGCRLYLSGLQVNNYARSPERLAKRKAKLGEKSGRPCICHEFDARLSVPSHLLFAH